MSDYVLAARPDHILPVAEIPLMAPYRGSGQLDNSASKCSFLEGRVYMSMPVDVFETVRHISRYILGLAQCTPSGDVSLPT